MSSEELSSEELSSEELGSEIVRCSWCDSSDLYRQYHDQEWGVTVRDDRELFEMLNLEGAQAGLSWITVLKKRENYRAAFDQFDPAKMALYDESKRQSLLANAGIIRNRLKVNAFIVNAQLFLAMQSLAEQGAGPTFSEFLWSFVNGEPILNAPKTMAEVPATSAESEAMSKALKQRGFKFVGSTICYAFMQACGMVVDHTMDCYKYKS